MAPWVVYMLRCGDGTLYTGVTNRLQERIRAHRQGKGARYTRGRGPLRLIYVEHAGLRGDALRRELEIKKLTRRDKLRLARTAA
ncbi:MAG: GIY-YIG nuclease family protein [Deltaproteobacteria bacterium]|nr:GIY-YIG nuclease family protein [Deltaproteobacteria bacterium]